MSHNESVQDLLDKIESILSKDYDEQMHLISVSYQQEIVRLNAVIEAWKDICRVSQNNEKILEKEIEGLVTQIEDLQYDKIDC